MLKRLSLLLSMCAASLALASPAYSEGYDVYGTHYSDAEIEAIIDATWDPAAAPTAKAVAWRESTWDPQALNYETGDAYCLFQITDVVEAEYGISEAHLDTPYECSAFAYQLYLDQGWWPWAETI